MIRLTLIKFCSKQTNWSITYTIRDRHGALLANIDDHPQFVLISAGVWEIMTWASAADVIEWVRSNLPNASIEWEVSL